MSLAKVTDHWEETVSDFILEQYKDASNWKAILKSVIDEYTDIEGEIWKLAPILDFKCRVKGERPSGALLDFVAAIKNVYRKPGETDSAFYDRFVAAVYDDNAGTPNNVIYNAAMISGDSDPQYMDEVDCHFFVYDGPRPNKDGGWDQGGRQLKRAEVKTMAPAGVLGMPGAAIRFADGSFMGDAEGRIFLAVADDNPQPKHKKLYLVTSSGEYLVTDAGKRLVVDVVL